MSLKNVVTFSKLNSTLTSIDKITNFITVSETIAEAAKKNKVANESNLVTDVGTTSTGIEKLTTEEDYVEDGQTKPAQGVCRINDIKGMESSFQKVCQKSVEIAKLCETSKPLTGKLKEVISCNSPAAIKSSIKSSTGEEPPSEVLAETTTAENAESVTTDIEEAKTSSQSIGESLATFKKGLADVMKATNGGELVKAALTSSNVLSNEINQIGKGVLLAEEILAIQEHVLNKDKDAALRYAIAAMDKKGVFKDIRATYNTEVIQDAIKFINPKLSSRSLAVIGSILATQFADTETLTTIKALLSKNKTLARIYIMNILKDNSSFINDNNLTGLINVFADYAINQFEIIVDNENKTVNKEDFEKEIYTIDPSLSNAVDNRLQSTVDFGDTTSPAFDMGAIANSWDNTTTSASYNKKYKFEYISSIEELINEFRASTREITEVVVHWTESFVDQGDLGSEEIHQWHEPIGGIGYHFVIKRNGDIQRGRPVNKQGVHADDHDKYSIGICLVAGYNCPSGTANKENYLNGESITGEQFNTLSNILRAFYTVWPGGQVWGHNDTDPNNAVDPGFDVPEFVYKKFGKVNISEYGTNPPLSTAELATKSTTPVVTAPSNPTPSAKITTATPKVTYDTTVIKKDPATGAMIGTSSSGVEFILTGGTNDQQTVSEFEKGIKSGKEFTVSIKDDQTGGTYTRTYNPTTGKSTRN